MSRTLRRWWWALLLVLLLALGSFVIWAGSPAPPMAEAQAALQGDDLVQATAESWLVYRPLRGDPTVGLVLYPGGRVDPRAYAPAAREVAREGYLVVVVPMPLNLAVFAPEKAFEVMTAFPEIEHWAVGGHSLGGAMAARFAHRHPETVQGLVLWAAYPASTDDLSGRSLAAVSIYGTHDGLATADKIAASRSLLPRDTRWVAIEGGNHAQFGWYGPQSGDRAASISREEQQRQIMEATSELLSRLAGSGS